jgi:hypothetical protein
VILEDLNRENRFPKLEGKLRPFSRIQDSSLAPRVMCLPVAQTFPVTLSPGSHSWLFTYANERPLPEN